MRRPFTDPILFATEAGTDQDPNKELPITCFLHLLAPGIPADPKLLGDRTTEYIHQVTGEIVTVSEETWTSVVNRIVRWNWRLSPRESPISPLPRTMGPTHWPDFNSVFGPISAEIEKWK
jgi:hypothetical protein